MRHHLPGDLNRSVKAAPAWLFESIPDVGPPIIIPFPFLKLEVEKSSEYLDLLEAPGIKVKPKLIDLLILFFQILLFDYSLLTQNLTYFLLLY